MTRYRSLAARRHVRRSAAATIIQTIWKTTRAMKNYHKAKSNIILIQSFMRMMFAIFCVKNIRSKLEKTANYHSNDSYVYSKQRTASSIKLQAIYRMYTIRRKYVLQKLQAEQKAALLKKQDNYMKRYMKRMDQVNSNIEETSNGDASVEIDLEQHKAVCPSLGKKQASQHTTAVYLSKYDYEASKQRQIAATKIQESYREHVYRSSRFTIVDGNIEIFAGSADIAAQMMNFSCSWFQQ